MTKEKKTLDMKNIIDQINIKSGDKVLVSSNILEILTKLKNSDKKFDPNLLIDGLIDKIGSNGTLMFPTFNWDFCKGKDFDYRKTPSKTGSLSNLALKRKDFKRTKNPIYSFAVTGKDKEYICNLDHESCFGLNSPYGYLIENHGKNLFIDIQDIYRDAFTLVHVAEEAVGVSYRYFKNFSGNYIDKFKKKKHVNYKMFVRNLNLNILNTIIDKEFDNVLIKKQAYEKKNINGINLILIDINKAYKAAIYDIKNKKGLIYPKKIKT
jgi:aminoglycoside 3-N-acetyltransferase